LNDLLKLAVEAHGGLARWNRLAAVVVISSRGEER
jgi:hypothetical protein